MSTIQLIILIEKRKLWAAVSKPYKNGTLRNNFLVAIYDSKADFPQNVMLVGGSIDFMIRQSALFRIYI